MATSLCISDSFPELTFLTGGGGTGDRVVSSFRSQNPGASARGDLSSLPPKRLPKQDLPIALPTASPRLCLRTSVWRERAISQRLLTTYCVCHTQGLILTARHEGAVPQSGCTLPTSEARRLMARKSLRWDHVTLRRLTTPALPLASLSCTYYCHLGELGSPCSMSERVAVRSGRPEQLPQLLGSP